MAIDLPRELKQRCGGIRARLEGMLSPGSIRWVHAEQMHLTLRFLGKVPVSQTTDLSEALKQAVEGVGAIRLSAVDLAFFPDEHRPRVIWIGIRGEVERLRAMQQRVEAAVRGFSQDPADKEFKAHITVGRAAKLSWLDVDALRETARQMSGQLICEWTVTSVHLYKSELSPAGARHEILSTALV